MKKYIHTLVAFLAMIAAGFAAGKNEIAPELAKALAAPDEVTLYSLEPRKGDDLKAGFHGYTILGQMQLKGDDRAVVVAEFNQAVKDSNGTSLRCFNPRHGLRVKSGGAEFDVVICFECHNYHAYKDNAD